MRYVVDGSNVIGRFGAVGDESAKRALVQRLSDLARERKSRVTCYFDGGRPANFGTHLGAVTVRFTEGVPADDLIVTELSASREPVTLISADLGLASRVRRRGVTVEDPRVLEQQARKVSIDDRTTDWESYFSDDKNRNL